MISPIALSIGLLVVLAARPSDAHLTYVVVRDPLKGTPPPPGSPWPMPQTHNATQTLLELNPSSFSMSSNAQSKCDIIDNAITRYTGLIFLQKTVPPPSGKPLLKTLSIHVEQFDGEDNCGYPPHLANENYTLTVSKNGSAFLDAPTVWGALRGLETFSQIVYIDDTTHNYFVNESTIVDYPRYGFRGVLVDSSRHFQPMEVLKQNLDAMSFNKFNVFHWHIVDDQSWPYQMTTYTNMTDAAFDQSLIYTQDNIKDIIEYARQRGIRVIPEVDTPGHTQSIGKIFPNILTACYGKGGRGTPDYPHFAAFEGLNPMQNYTYDVMKTVFQEVKKTFPDKYLHLGMDEVNYDCWASSPEIAEFMKKQNFATIAQVEQYYIKKTLDNVRDLGAKYMIWQDPIDNGVKAADDTIVGVWKDSYNGAAHNYQIVLSAPWYLDNIGASWATYYEIDPDTYVATAPHKELVVGGETCMWAEYVDATNLLPRVWPRAGAVAERLWSDKSMNNTEEAKFRLDEQRCRMIRRGIPTEPLLPGYCGSYDWENKIGK